MVGIFGLNLFFFFVLLRLTSLLWWNVHQSRSNPLKRGKKKDCFWFRWEKAEHFPLQTHTKLICDFAQQVMPFTCICIRSILCLVLISVVSYGNGFGGSKQPVQMTNKVCFGTCFFFVASFTHLNKAYTIEIEKQQTKYNLISSWFVSRCYHKMKFTADKT